MADNGCGMGVFGVMGRAELIWASLVGRQQA